MRIFWEMSVVKIFIVLIVISLGSFAVADEKEKEKQIVAKVNEAEITNKDFNRAFSAALQQFSRIGWDQSDSEKMAELKGKVIDRLIDIELLYQQGMKKGISLEKQELEDDLEKFKQQFKEKDGYKNFLAANKLTEEEFKQQLQKKNVISKLQKALLVEFNESVVINDEKVKEFYEKNLESFKSPESVRASHILVSVEKDADEPAKKEARSKIEEIQKKINNGEDFAELAKSISDCPSSSNGGDLGFFTRGQMVAPFEEAAFKLSSGEMSDIVETNFGYHLIKVTDRNEAQTQSFEEAKADIDDWLRQQEIEAKFQQFIEELRSSAKIEIFQE